MGAERKRREITGLLHLDPRSKLLILVLFSVVVMIDVVDGPAYIVRVIMTFIPVILVCAEGKIHIGARFTLLFIAATWLQSYTQQNIGGVPGMLILFLCYMITQFAPTMITVWYCISTTKISEFMAAMNRMHAPQGLSISMAVMMRFFPTLAEEYRSINDAMRMRGIQFGGGKVTRSGRKRFLKAWICWTLRTNIRWHFRAGKSKGWRLPPHSPRMRKFFFLMNLPPGWITGI